MGKHTAQYYGKRSLVSLENHLWTTNANGKKRQFFPKSYEFPFSFELPKSLPCPITVTHANGENKVSYRLKVYTDDESWFGKLLDFSENFQVYRSE